MTAAYLHPIAGAATLAFLLYAAVLGLRMRTAKGGRTALAERHARIAPIVYAAVAANWLAGLASAVWLRSELTAAESVHFRIGSAMLIALTGSAATARWMRRPGGAARDVHPWFGIAAVLCAAAQLMTGLQLIP